MSEASSSGPGARPKPTSLRRLFSWALVGQGTYAASQWALLVAIAKLLTPAAAERAADQWVFALALCAPFVLFAQAEMRVLLSAESPDAPRFGTRSYLAARRGGNLAMAAAVLAVGAWALPDLASYRVLAWLVLARIIEGRVDIVYGHYQKAERHAWQAQSQIARGCLGLLLGGLGLWLTDSLEWMVAGMALAWLIILLAWDRRRLTSLRFTAESDLDPRATQRLWRRAWPLAVAAALISLNSSLPRYVLEALAPEGRLGIFGSVAYLLVVMTLVNQALRGATLPRFAVAWQRGERRAASRVLVGTLLVAALPGLALALLALLWGGPLLVLLYNGSYADQGPLFAWLSLAAAAGGIAGCLRAALTAMGRIRSQVPVTALAATVTGICAWVWVPESPLLGAATAVLAGRSAMALVHAGILVHAWRPSGPKR